MIKRKSELPVSDTSGPRTIYSKGWPTPYTIEDVQTHFSAFGKVLSVRIKKHFQTKEQKDSCFVEFASEEDVKNVLADTKASTYKDKTLTIKKKEDYWAEKKGKRKDKRKTDGDEKGEKEEITDGNNNNNEKSSKKSKAEPKAEDNSNYANHPKEWKKGLIISFTNIGADQTRETLREIFEAYAPLQYIDFHKGKEDGHLRFSTPEGAKKALEEMTSSKREIGGKVPVLKLLEGEAEENYLKQVAEGQAKKKHDADSKKKSFRGRKKKRDSKFLFSRNKNYSLNI